ncbi:hypothetical protein [Methanobrevibacter arboriphilus]|nr:hypothetical protein [Methanobrevibacter arboriphilus]
MKDIIKDKAMQIKELNIKIPVPAVYETNLLEELNRISQNNEIHEDEKKMLRDALRYRQTDNIGTVKFNNYLDIWDGESYCYEGKENRHKGISIVDTPLAIYPVIINVSLPERTYNDFKSAIYVNRNEITAHIISFNEAFDEIEKSEHVKLIYEKFPEFEKYKKDPINHSNIKTDSIAIHNSFIFTLQVMIDELMEKNKEYEKQLDKYINVVTALENKES